MCGKKSIKVLLTTIILTFSTAFSCSAHQVYFCGEAIPTDRQFVANKLMNVIYNQMPNVTLAYLRYQAQRYFPKISEWLKYYHIPDDFKYIPIIECGFRNLSSSAGARGFWQLMPQVAVNLGLSLYPYDQRDDPTLSTKAACMLICEHYAFIKKKLGRPSWILTAASYNFGPGNVLDAIRSQGADYFNMQLNAETAEYVYRLVAVKELFERPELYMKGFGTNIFSDGLLPESLKKDKQIDLTNLQRGPATNVNRNNDASLGSMHIIVLKEGEQLHPQTRDILVAARIISDRKPLKDGQMMRFELLEGLQTSDFSKLKGSEISGQAWIIDGRVFVDFGVGDELELEDLTEQRGINYEVAQKNHAYVLLKSKIETGD